MLKSMDGTVKEEAAQSAAIAVKARNEAGRFQKGNPGGPGRPKGSGANPKRVQYVHATFESVSVQEWKAILAKAKRDALGVKIIAQDGRSVVVDDPESIGIVRSNARIFIRDAIIGKPAQSIHVDSESDAYDEYAGFSDDELRAIISAGDGGGSVTELSDAELAAVARGIDGGGG